MNREILNENNLHKFGNRGDRFRLSWWVKTDSYMLMVRRWEIETESEREESEVEKRKWEICEREREEKKMRREESEAEKRKRDLWEKKRKKEKKKRKKKISSTDLIESYGSKGDPRDEKLLVYSFLFFNSYPIDFSFFLFIYLLSFVFSIFWWLWFVI